MRQQVTINIFTLNSTDGKEWRRSLQYSMCANINIAIKEIWKEALNPIEWINGVLGTDSALLRLYRTGDNLGYWDEFCYALGAVSVALNPIDLWQMSINDANVRNTRARYSKQNSVYINIQSAAHSLLLNKYILLYSDLSSLQTLIYQLLFLWHLSNSDALINMLF